MADNLERGITEIVVDDLRALLFWASVGMRLSTGGYKEEELEHILTSYAEPIGFEFPESPKWGIERLSEFRNPEPRRRECEDQSHA